MEHFLSNTLINKNKKISNSKQVNVPDVLNQVVWTEQITDEGKYYYYNTVSNVTTWEKPIELFTRAEYYALVCILCCCCF